MVALQLSSRYKTFRTRMVAIVTTADQVIKLGIEEIVSAKDIPILELLPV